MVFVFTVDSTISWGDNNSIFDRIAAKPPVELILDPVLTLLMVAGGLKGGLGAKLHCLGVFKYDVLLMAIATVAGKGISDYALQELGVFRFRRTKKA
jgi:hypothetical protein